MNGHAWYTLGMAWHHSREPDKVKEVAEHMVRFDPQMTRKLIQDTEQANLAPLVAYQAGWGRWPGINTRAARCLQMPVTCQEGRECVGCTRGDIPESI